MDRIHSNRRADPHVGAAGGPNACRRQESACRLPHAALRRAAHFALSADPRREPLALQSLNACAVIAAIELLNVNWSLRSDARAFGMTVRQRTRQPTEPRRLRKRVRPRTTLTEPKDTRWRPLPLPLSVMDCLVGQDPPGPITQQARRADMAIACSHGACKQEDAERSVSEADPRTRVARAADGVTRPAPEPGRSHTELHHVD